MTNRMISTVDGFMIPESSRLARERGPTQENPPLRDRFRVGVAQADKLVGVAMIGRPVARHLQDGWTVEVLRTCTDGTPNVNSMLYGASWRAAKALGFRRIITYTQEGESGSSLFGAGWRIVAQRKPRSGWDVPSRPRTSQGTEWIARTLWEGAA